MTDPGQEHFLTHHRVEKSPPSIYYIPEFITKEEEKILLQHVYSAPKPKWTQLAHRKLQNWGGLPHPKGMVAEDLPPYGAGQAFGLGWTSSGPRWLKIYADKIAALGIFEDKVPNHVLVNEYEAGQGIMPHEDGPLFYPTVSTISLGSHTLLDFYHHIKEGQTENNEETSTSFDDRYFSSLLLEPRSLVLVCDDMYKVHLHGISERKEDIITDKIANLDMCKTTVNMGDTLQRTTRVSLTIRYVPKILKAKLLFGKSKR